MDDLDHAIVLEMQTKNREFLPKRVRYYQSLIDLDFLERGQDYETLNESTIVFFCSFDPFDNGLPVYTFRNVCAEDAALELGDGTSKIFLNIKTKEKKATDEKEKIDVKAMEDRNKELKPFFDYLCGRPTEDDFVKRLDEAVQKVKSNEKWRLDYVMYDLEMRDREREAVDSALTRAVRNLMQTKNWTAKDAMDALLIPPTKQAVFAPLLA